MLNEDIWEALRLSPVVVRERSNYFEMYANSVTAVFAPDVDTLIDEARAGAVPTDEPFTWLEEPGEDERLTPSAPVLREARGFDQAIAADALREAGRALLMLDIPHGLGLLDRAGPAYAAAGVPYGWFLQAFVNHRDEAPFVAGSMLARAWAQVEDDDAHARPFDGVENGDPWDPNLDRAPRRLAPELAAARVPPQMLSLLLATHQDADSAAGSDAAWGVLGDQPVVRSAVAVGATGLPLEDWWTFLQAIDAEDYYRVRTQLRLFASAHGRQLSQAQRTSQCLAVRRQRAAHSATVTADDFTDLEPLALVSISVGLAVADADSGPEPATGTGVDGDPSSGGGLLVDDPHYSNLIDFDMGLETQESVTS
jgi:hypothetical protein